RRRSRGEHVRCPGRRPALGGLAGARPAGWSRTTGARRQRGWSCARVLLRGGRVLPPRRAARPAGERRDADRSGRRAPTVRGGAVGGGVGVGGRKDGGTGPSAAP